MLIDWYTVIAQGLNFLILVWLLQRFAYRPILNAIQVREQSIANQLSAAATAQTTAAAERTTLERKVAELEQQRATTLEELMQEAAAARSRLLDEARQDAQAERARLHAALDAEWMELKGTLSVKIRTEVLGTADQVLTALANASLNDVMVERFLDQLGHLPENDRILLQAQHGTLIIRSSFDATPAARTRIQTAVARLITSGRPLEFITAADLICGVELQADGYQWAWSVRHCLEELGGRIEAILPGPAADQAPPITSTAATVP